MKKLVLFLVLISVNCFAIDFGNIPPTIIKNIVDKALVDYPNDYTMQNQSIETNVLIYKKVIKKIAEASQETRSTQCQKN